MNTGTVTTMSRFDYDFPHTERTHLTLTKGQNNDPTWMKVGELKNQGWVVVGCAVDRALDDKIHLALERRLPA